MNEMTAAAQFLNDAFAGFDSAILTFYHDLAVRAGGVLTPAMKILTLLGEKGLLFFALAVVLCCFRRTRKMGVCVFGAVCCGALVTNILLKDWVARPRPFLSGYAEWWQFVGAPAEDGFSFPSGHATACMAGTLALCLTGRAKARWGLLAFPALVAASRNYLMAHYPSDVLAGLLIGACAAMIACDITNFIYRYLHAHENRRWCRFALRADARGLFVK